ncbi:MAG: hypothetical protein LCH59_12490 [Proteobacteria bacterium]|nr:hypothetical protein [Pseudomonadota bacterium]
MKITHERWYPRLLGIATAAAAWTLCKYFGIKLPQGENMLSALVSLGGILAGFLATMKTLLMGMKEESISRLKKSGYMPHLRDYLSEALWGSLALCVFAVAGFSPSVGATSSVYLSVLVGLFVYSFAALYRVTRIGMGLLTQR